MDSLVPQVSYLLLPFILSQGKTAAISTSTYPAHIQLLFFSWTGKIIVKVTSGIRRRVHAVRSSWPAWLCRLRTVVAWNISPPLVLWNRHGVRNNNVRKQACNTTYNTHVYHLYIKVKLNESINFSNTLEQLCPSVFSTSCLLLGWRDQEVICK